MHHLIRSQKPGGIYINLAEKLIILNSLKSYSMLIWILMYTVAYLKLPNTSSIKMKTLRAKKKKKNPKKFVLYTSYTLQYSRQKKNINKVHFSYSRGQQGKVHPIYFTNSNGVMELFFSHDARGPGLKWHPFVFPHRLWVVPWGIHLIPSNSTDTTQRLTERHLV